MSNQLATLTVTDLQTAGINSQLTSNDLIEVVANDIYEKYIDAINAGSERYKELRKEYDDLLLPELNKMKESLKKYIGKDKAQVVEDAEDDSSSEVVTMSFNKVEGYWSNVYITNIYLHERDKGSTVETQCKSLYHPSLKSKTAKVKLQIVSGQQTDEQDVKVGAITGEIKTVTSKKFEQIVTIPIARFVKLNQSVAEHNKRMAELLSFLPKNGVLSVDRFTRDARVKMNKKIISNQSADFKKKISELFNIKL